MRKRKGLRKGLLILCLALALAGGLCFGASRLLAGQLPSQYAAERWRGESETDYGQVSCFVPVDEKLTLEQI